MDVHLHIGWHKTGTTAIQSFLAHNRRALQQRWGACYPEAGLYNVAHNLPAWALQGPLRAKLLQEIGCSAGAEALLRDMLEEAARAGSRSVIVSSEEFAPIHRYDLGRLVRAFDGHRVAVIAYIRRQDEYIESVYNQMVRFWRSRYTGAFDAFVERQLQSGRLDYHAYFGQWASAFGKDSLRIRIYDRERFRDRDVRLDFCDVIGIDDAGLERPAGDVNESVDADSAQFLARFNRVPLTREQHQAMIRAVRDYSASHPDAPRALLGAGERRRIAGHFARSNEAFSREFLGGAGEFPPIDEQEEAPRRFDESRFLDMLGYVLPRLAREGKGRRAAGAAKAGRARPARRKRRAAGL